MSWTCQNPDCGMRFDDDSLRSCPACGFSRIIPCTLVLTSDQGISWQTNIPFEIDRSVYKDIFAKEYRYILRGEYEFPYKVFKDDTGAWFLLANPNARLATKIDSEVCESNKPYELSEGMVIRLADRDNPTSGFAPVTVSFKPLP